MALTSDRQLRKRASTQAMQENAEPNKRTDRSQNHDDDQATAHDLLEEIRRRSQKKEGYVEKPVRQRLRLYCCGCEEDVSGGGECRRCGHTSCPVCLNERILRRERSVDPSHKPNQANKRHDAQTNNQTRAVPATDLSQAIKIDEDPETETDSVLYIPGLIEPSSAAPAKVLARRSTNAHVGMSIAEYASVTQMSPSRQQVNLSGRFEICKMGVLLR
ncbi:hypothetical protein RJZ56_000872 [Blastomyces dermatitidis]